MADIRKALKEAGVSEDKIQDVMDEVWKSEDEDRENRRLCELEEKVEKLMNKVFYKEKADDDEKELNKCVVHKSF